jgi:hypothetical protein
LINSISDNLLLTCFAIESHVATLEMLDEVAHDLRLDPQNGRRAMATAHPVF